MRSRAVQYAAEESNAYYQDYQLTQDGIFLDLSNMWLDISIILYNATSPQKGE